ncbi:MAG: TIGR03086 family metal-binding protein [Actinomycetota bacterium]
MSELAERFRRIAGQFTERVRAVPPGAWDNPAPCEGWVARDVVRHMIEYMPRLFFGSAGLELPNIPSVDEDPVGAWEALCDALEAVLDDPEIAAREVDLPIGHVTLAEAINQIGTNDILVHTWDLARATGLEERLDPEAVHEVFEGMEPHDAALRESGHFGPRVEVSHDADEQTKLLAFMGRRP